MNSSNKEAPIQWCVEPHNVHVHPTLYAIQTLATQNALDKIDVGRVTDILLSLQLPSGAFAGVRFGGTDTRFLYCAVNALLKLGQLSALDNDGSDREDVQYRIRAMQEFQWRIWNITWRGEPCWASARAIRDQLDPVDVDTLAWWLAERQLPGGGLNGWHEKLEDVCYSFWVLSALSTLNKLHWINAEKLISFILYAQDPEVGGIANRPNNAVDVLHTHFSVAGLSLLGYPNLEDLDPVYCMPARVTEKLGLRKALPRRETWP